MKKIVLPIFLLFLVSVQGMAQSDSTRQVPLLKEAFLKHQILPVSLIAAGSFLNIGTIKYDIREKLPVTSFHADDFFQYTPVGQLYLYDLLGCKHRNSVFDQTKYLAISWISTSIIVSSLKRTTKVQRPVGGKTSFPSGHTTTAFMGATVLYHEFKDSEPVLAYSGYLFATATGFLRMTNQAHWLPDVLAGAGIGILTTNLVYYFKPLKNFQPFKKNAGLTLMPIISPQEAGLLCRF